MVDDAIGYFFIELVGGPADGNKYYVQREQVRFDVPVCEPIDFSENFAAGNHKRRIATYMQRRDTCYYDHAGTK